MTIIKTNKPVLICFCVVASWMINQQCYFLSEQNFAFSANCLRHQWFSWCWMSTWMSTLLVGRKSDHVIRDEKVYDDLKTEVKSVVTCQKCLEMRVWLSWVWDCSFNPTWAMVSITFSGKWLPSHIFIKWQFRFLGLTLRCFFKCEISITTDLVNPREY